MKQDEKHKTMKNTERGHQFFWFWSHISRAFCDGKILDPAGYDEMIPSSTEGKS